MGDHYWDSNSRTPLSLLLSCAVHKRAAFEISLGLVKFTRPVRVSNHLTSSSSLDQFEFQITRPHQVYSTNSSCSRVQCPGVVQLTQEWTHQTNTARYVFGPLQVRGQSPQITTVAPLLRREPIEDQSTLGPTQFDPSEPPGDQPSSRFRVECHEFPFQRRGFPVSFLRQSHLSF